MTVGKKTTVTVTVKNKGRAVRNARVLVRGAGISAAARTNSSGKAKFKLTPKRVGILRLNVAGQPSCAAKRVGIVASFRPPITG
jgi:phage tail tape-measure protein